VFNFFEKAAVLGKLQKIRQWETSHRSNYIRNMAHALCLLHKKVYKRTLRIYKTIFFQQQQQ